MKARMKSSKYKKKTRKESSRGIHPSLLISTAACLLFRSSRKRDSEAKRIFSPLYAFHCKNKFSRGSPAL